MVAMPKLVPSSLNIMEMVKRATQLLESNGQDSRRASSLMRPTNDGGTTLNWSKLMLLGGVS